MSNMNDISKQVWKFQEGLVYLGLCSFFGNEMIFWNYEKGIGRNSKKRYTPEGMSIDPDLVIGKDKDNPIALVFVTHATAEMAGQKKFWRTVPEIIEEKAIQSHPSVYSVLYAGNNKDNIKAAYEVLFDGVFHLDDSEAGVAISNALMRLTALKGECQPTEALKELNAFFLTHKDLWKAFVDGLKAMVANSAGEMHSSLVNMLLAKQSRMPKQHPTYLLWGVSKLFTLPSNLQQEIIQKKDIVKDIPRHSLILGWFSPVASTRGTRFRLCDKDIHWLVNNLSSEEIFYILEKGAQLPNFCQYSAEINRVAQRAVCNSWIIDHYYDLTASSFMKSSIRAVFEDPQSVFDNKDESFQLNTNWLFEQLMLLFRLNTGRKDGYGYSTLGTQTGYVHEISGHPGLVITPFIQRKKMIPEDMLDAISRVFADNVKQIGFTRLSELVHVSEYAYCDSTFKYKIVTYSGFRPIEWLLLRSLELEGIGASYPVTHRSFISSFVEGRTTSSGNLMRINEKTWIKCQSGYNGKDDKRKELCGRIGAMKLAYIDNTPVFFLVIDGLFNQVDLELLDKAGWDGIYTCDEISLVIKRIKESIGS